MMDEVLYRLAELERRLNNIVRVTTVDERSGDKVRVKDGSGLKTGLLPWVSRRAGNDREWWAPEVGEQVLLFCPSGDPALGVVLPSIYQDAYPAPADTETVYRKTFRDGAVIEYDGAAHKLTATVPGEIEATATDVLRGTAPDIIWTGAVQVFGPIHATESITSETSITAPAVGGTGSVSSPSVLAGGDEVTDHDHECPACGSRTSILGE